MERGASDQRLHGETVAREDPELSEMCGRIQLPLMLKMMARPRYTSITKHFVRKGFTSGFRYADNIPLTGLYDRVPDGKELGKFEKLPLSELRARKRTTGQKEDTRGQAFLTQRFQAPSRLVIESRHFEIAAISI